MCCCDDPVENRGGSPKSPTGSSLAQHPLLVPSGSQRVPLGRVDDDLLPVEGGVDDRRGLVRTRPRAADPDEAGVGPRGAGVQAGRERLGDVPPEAVRGQLDLQLLDAGGVEDVERRVRGGPHATPLVTLRTSQHVAVRGAQPAVVGQDRDVRRDDGRHPRRAQRAGRRGHVDDDDLLVGRRVGVRDDRDLLGRRCRDDGSGQLAAGSRGLGRRRSRRTDECHDHHREDREDDARLGAGRAVQDRRSGRGRGQGRAVTLGQGSSPVCR